MAVIDNADEYLADLEKQVPTRKRHVLHLANNSEYAEELHNRLGYFVFSPSHEQQQVVKHFRKLNESSLPFSNRNIDLTMDAIGYDEINFLRSYTDEMRPPVKAGEGERKAHPGGWSDISGNLKASYQHQVNNGPVRTDPDYD